MSMVLMLSLFVRNSVFTMARVMTPIIISRSGRLTLYQRPLIPLDRCLFFRVDSGFRLVFAFLVRPSVRFFETDRRFNVVGRA